MRKAAVYCMTRNLYEIAVPSIKSLLVNSDVDVVYLLIEDDEFPVKLPRTKVINVSGQKFFNPGGINYNSQYTYMVMMRAALSKVLKEHLVLSLDCDTFVLGDLSPLWELPIKDYYLAGGMEPDKSLNNLYVNMGVALFNLAKLRKDGMTDRIINALNRTPYAFVEQDCINEHCAGKILEFPPEYNVHTWAKQTDKEPVIIHYAGLRDWRHTPEYKKFAAVKERDLK